MVQSEFAFNLFNDTPEKKILSFSNLNGIIAKERTFLPISFATCERMGANAAPDFPAKFAIMTIVEKPSIFSLMLSMAPNDIPRIRNEDGLRIGLVLIK